MDNTIQDHIHYPKNYTRGTAIKIRNTIIEDGEIVTMATEPYIASVKINILSPSGYPVVYEENMTFDDDEFYYVWQTERTSDRGEYVIEVMCVDANDITSIDNKSTLILE